MIYLIASIFIFLGWVKFQEWKADRHYNEFYVKPVKRGKEKIARKQKRMLKRMSKPRPKHYVRVNGGQGFWL